jgi:hypothetical protein
VNIGVLPSLTPCTSAGTHTSLIPRRYRVIVSSRFAPSGKHSHDHTNERTYVETFFVQLHKPTLKMH